MDPESPAVVSPQAQAPLPLPSIQEAHQLKTPPVPSSRLGHSTSDTTSVSVAATSTTPPTTTATSNSTSTATFVSTEVPQFRNTTTSRHSSFSSSSSISFQFEPSPASPKNTIAVHARSQTIDVLHNAVSTSTNGPPSGHPIKRKPVSITASTFPLRSSSFPVHIPTPLDLPKPSHRFTRPFSVDSPTLYEFSPDSRSRSANQ